MGRARAFLPLLGFGIYMSWSLCMPWARNQFAYGQAAPGGLGVFVHGFVLLALAFMCNRRRSDLYSPRNLVIGGACATVAPLLSVAATYASSIVVVAPVLAAAGSLCEGTALALLYLLWNEQLACRPMRTSWPAYAASFAAAPAVYFVLAALPASFAAVIVFCLPVLSCFALHRCACAAMADETELEEASRSWQFPWRPALIMTIFSFAHYMLMHLMGGSAAMGQFGGLIAAGVLVVACTAGFDRFDPRVLYKICPALMVCALLLFQVGAASFGDASCLLGYAGFVGFNLFMAFILSSVCFRYDVRPAWLFGIVEGCNVFAHAAGSIVGKVLLASSGSVPGQLELTLDAVVVALVLLSMLLLSERDFSTTWGIEPMAQPAVGEQLPAHVGQAGLFAQSAALEHSLLMGRIPRLLGEDSLDDRCARIGRHYGLTRREEEVLALLAQGCSAADIENALYISHNTAKGHIRHVYAKLDVHSREEAAEVVNGHQAGRGPK